MFKLGSTSLTAGATGIDVYLNTGGTAPFYTDSYVYSPTGTVLLSSWLVALTGGGDYASFVFSGSVPAGYEYTLNWITMSETPLDGWAVVVSLAQRAQPALQANPLQAQPELPAHP